MLRPDHIHFSPNDFSLRIYVNELKEFTSTTITFDGYFRAEAKLLPLRQLMYVYDLSKTKFDCHLISIDSKEVLDDTSKGTYDDEVGGYICLTPTEITKISYRILYTFKENDDKDLEYYKRLDEEIQKECEDRYEENRRLRDAREQAEHEEAMRSYVAPKSLCDP